MLPILTSQQSTPTTMEFRRRVSAALLTLILALSAAPPRSPAQDIAMVEPTDVIPKKDYKTWSLFLVCNPEWLSADKSSDLYGLFQKFQAFGQTIGKDHLAVWFWKSRKSAMDPNLASNVDVERSIRFCKALKLKPSESPHIVVLDSYPDETNLPTNFAVFQLATMSPNDIAALLAKLSDQLLLQNKVAPPSPTEPQGQLWIRLLSAAQQMIGNFGCAWSFKINAGVLSADLHSCKNP